MYGRNSLTLLKLLHKSTNAPLNGVFDHICVTLICSQDEWFSPQGKMAMLGQQNVSMPAFIREKATLIDHMQSILSYKLMSALEFNVPVFDDRVSSRAGTLNFSPPPKIWTHSFFSRSSKFWRLFQSRKNSWRFSSSKAWIRRNLMTIMTSFSSSISIQLFSLQPSKMQSSLWCLPTAKVQTKSSSCTFPFKPSTTL